MRCALGVGERLEQLNRNRVASGRSPLSVSIGLHTGAVVAGTIGALDRHEYTVIGDTVNVAARLQQLSKERGNGLVLSTATYDLANPDRSTGAPLRESMLLRGRETPVEFVTIAPSAAG
jgi:class 3 adenylate cyclase